MDYTKIPDYLLGLLGTFRSYVGANETDVIVTLCGAMFLILLFAWAAWLRGGRLKRQLEELKLSNQRLLTAEETRLLWELRRPPKPEGRG